jgi:tRNA(Ile)-lysidine synthase
MAALASEKKPGVVAVSGGADSVALLRTLRTVHPGTLTVAHLNHQLRGTESDGDEAFVRELANQLGLHCRVKVLNVAMKAAGANLEGTARQLRYEFFAETAAEVGANWIATGHTADDQAETVLHRLIRGTGLRGLRGIQAIRGAQSVRHAGNVSQLINDSHDSNRGLTPPARLEIVRPFLTVTRMNVIEYLTSLNQPFREDSSNADPRFTRNRLRHELLPLLKTYNPAIVASLGQIAAQAGEAFDLVEAHAARLAADVELPRAGDRLILDAVKLATAHPFLVREMLRLLWHREGWPASDMTADHWTRLVAVARGNLAAEDFPEGLSARRVGRVVQIGQ